MWMRTVDSGYRISDGACRLLYCTYGMLLSLGTGLFCYGQDKQRFLSDFLRTERLVEIVFYWNLKSVPL